MIDWSKIDTKGFAPQPPIKVGNIGIQLGPHKKVVGGTEERQRVLYKGRLLRGYVRIGREFGGVNITTHFNGDFVEGRDIFWLLRRNCITVKRPENYENPVVIS